MEDFGLTVGVIVREKVFLVLDHEVNLAQVLVTVRPSVFARHELYRCSLDLVTFSQGVVTAQLIF